MQIETDRLLIRNMNIADTDDLYRVLSDETVMRYIEPVYTRGRTHSFIEKYGMCNPPLVYALEHKQSGEVIGHLIFHPYDKCFYELGWVISRQYHNLGYAAEVTEAIINYASAHKIKGLVIECSPAQRVSAHIALSHGFELAEKQGSVQVYRLKLYD